MVFKTTPSGDSSSDGSFQTYLSTCRSIYTTRNVGEINTHSRLPYVSSPVPQSWGATPVPTTIDTTAIDSVPLAPVVSDKLARMKSENACLQHELREMKQQLQQISECQRQFTVAPAPTPDLPTIVAAVLSSLQTNSSTSSPASPPHRQARSPTDGQSIMASGPHHTMDLSFTASSVNKDDE
ncbi:hypothetical protein ACA910_009995 [Epithemia clementina (nom. ined.)]